MRVVIADDHSLFREGLRGLLEARGVEVVGEAADGAQAVTLARRHRPDVVLVDLKMPGTDGLAAIRDLSVQVPETRTLVVTASEEDADLFDAIRAGAHGYVPKNLAAPEFFTVLEAVARGEPGLTPKLARKVLDAFARGGPARRSTPDPDALTEREQEVLHLLVEGVTSNRDLAERLVVSENTVKYHLRNILEKLHVQNRAQLVARALRDHLVEE